MDDERKRCGKLEVHQPHWWPASSEATVKHHWCDGKPPYKSSAD